MSVLLAHMHACAVVEDIETAKKRESAVGTVGTVGTGSLRETTRNHSLEEV